MTVLMQPFWGDWAICLKIASLIILLLWSNSVSSCPAGHRVKSSREGVWIVTAVRASSGVQIVFKLYIQAGRPASSIELLCGLWVY